MLKKIILSFLLFSFFILLFLLSPTSLSNDLPAGEAGKIRFVIPPDANNEYIVKQLKDQHFIRSTRLFNIMVTILNPLGKIEPGAYQLSHNMTLIAVANTLLFNLYQKWVIVKPGLRLEQTADLMTEKMKWNEEKKKDFLDNSREGYMFPDTYLINVDYTGKETADKLINNFNEKFSQNIIDGLLANNIRNDTAIKIASLIERESGGDDDKALIAGIILELLRN